MTEPTKFLIASVSTEHESFVAVIECTPEYLEILRKRIATAAELKKVHEDFARLKFFDSADLYEWSDATDEWMAEHGDEDCVMVLTDQDPGFDDRARVDFTYLHVDEDSVFWSIRPKHSSDTCETALIYAKDELFTK